MDNNGLKEKSNMVRNRILEMCLQKGGHLASAFSCVDILTALYYGGILKIDPKKPEWPERDRFILSKGHGATALYAILADLGFFHEKEIINYCKKEGILGAHPDMKIPGVEISSGSLGHGLGIGVGMALAAKMDKKDHKTVVLMGDGECAEGSVWEAAMFGCRHKLDNLLGIIDRNRICATDLTENCICLDPLKEKWVSFGWETVEVDGHSFKELLDALKDFRKKKNRKPMMIIANTVKGKGISFMENDPGWHVRLPSGEQIEAAKKELQWRKDGAF